MKKTMKGAVPIRSLVFSMMVVLTFLYAFVGFIGSYQIANNIPMNATLKQEYITVTGNQTNANIFANSSTLINQTATQASQLGGLGSINSIGMASQFFNSIPTTYTLIAQLTVGALSKTLGINLTPFQNNITLLITIIIVLAILSAIFLFPI